VKFELCPRCGGKISWIERRRVGGNVYYFAVHEWREGGKRRIRKCYLGPDTYIYVSVTHEGDTGLVFHGLVDRRRAVKYLEDIVEYLENFAKTANEDEVKEVVGDLEKSAGRLAKVIEQLKAKLPKNQ